MTRSPHIGQKPRDKKQGREFKRELSQTKLTVFPECPKPFEPSTWEMREGDDVVATYRFESHTHGQEYTAPPGWAIAHKQERCFGVVVTLVKL